VRHSAAGRLAAFALALLVSLTAPALALSHGLAHGHLADEHAAEAHAVPEATHEGDHDHGMAPGAMEAHHDLDGVDAASVVLRPAEHGHEHDHATLDVAPGARELGRLVPLAVLAHVPATVPPATVVEVRSAALSDRALLARPDPRSGPPPALRAPPLR
jgi:hypothetical protein